MHQRLGLFQTYLNHNNKEEWLEACIPDLEAMFSIFPFIGNVYMDVSPVAFATVVASCFMPIIEAFFVLMIADVVKGFSVSTEADHLFSLNLIKYGI